MCLSIAFVGCSTLNVGRPSLTFEKILGFKIGVTDKAFVQEQLGVADKVETQNGEDSLTYDDRKDGFQRLTLNFDPSSRKLTSFAWLTREGEKESSVAYAKTIVKSAKFIEESSIKEKVHYIPNEFLLRDDAAGIAIYFTRVDGREYAEAISFTKLF